MLGDVDQYVVPIVWINLFAQQMLSENQFRTTYVVRIGTWCWSKPTQHLYLRSLNICCVKTLQMLCKARLHNILAQHMLIVLLIEHFLRVRPSEYLISHPSGTSPSPFLSLTISLRKAALLFSGLTTPWPGLLKALRRSVGKNRETYYVREAFLFLTPANLTVTLHSRMPKGRPETFLIFSDAQVPNQVWFRAYQYFSCSMK